MNRRKFLAVCATGAPLIAIPTAVQAHGPTAKATGKTAQQLNLAPAWPNEVVELYVSTGLFAGEKYYIPSWGKVKE